MKLETFFEKFDQFADAPDAVAKMRELVLELAVQGKLVEQKPTEGDGHALLRQIHKKNPPPPAEADGEPVDSELPTFPNSWASSKLGDVAEIIRGVTFPGSAKSETRSIGDVACLRTASVQAEVDWDDLIYISPTYVSREDQWVTPNDIMISMANSYALVGKVAIVRKVPQKATFGAFLAAIRPVLIEPYFLLYVLRSPRMQAAFRASSSQTTNIANISLGRMRPLPFPLPPLAEQKRIVAKVDELMALCDRLEAQQQERAEQASKLARASLARFADAPTPANLHFLFHKSYAIPPADLRKSILTLAVQGKLVPQDPNDEPAEASFPNLASLAVESEDDDFPLQWLRVPLGKMGELRGGGTPSKSRPEFWKGDLPWVSPKDMKMLHIADAQDHISPQAVEGSSVRLIPHGSLLMVVRGMILARAFPVALTMREVTINQDMKALLPSEPKTKEYLLLALRAIEPDVLAAIEHSSHGTCKLKTEFLQDFVIPLPPLAEQRRIVAKVEQLMALVDALEQQIAGSRNTAANLLSALVAELTLAESH